MLETETPMQVFSRFRAGLRDPILPNLRLTIRVRVLKEVFPNLILRPNVINVRVMNI